MHEFHINEAKRLAIICNSCRYCEGLCAVFPAIELMRDYQPADLTYLSNLCHNCGACFDDCQFAPPHEFLVDMPKALKNVRRDSYSEFLPSLTYPKFLLFIALAMGFFMVMVDQNAETGGFYFALSHQKMIALFIPIFILSMGVSFYALWLYWRKITQEIKMHYTISGLKNALMAAFTLKFVDGGGGGCADTSLSKHAHHLTAFGFMLCFLATILGTIYHYFLAQPAPYAWYELPKLAGIIGGISLSIGASFLLKNKFAQADLRDSRFLGELCFVILLLLTAVSGLIVYILGSSQFMPMALTIHLGLVAAFFLTIPFSKMMHAPYRILSLIRYYNSAQS